MAALKTIAVFHPNGVDRILINADDFDATKHREWKPPTPTPSGASPPSGLPPPASPPAPPPAPPPIPQRSSPPISPRAQRETQLKAMDWRELKAIAEGFTPPLTKPETGWDDVVPLILKKEFGN